MWNKTQNLALAMREYIATHPKIVVEVTEVESGDATESTDVPDSSAHVNVVPTPSDVISSGMYVPIEVISSSTTTSSITITN